MFETDCLCRARLPARISRLPANAVNVPIQLRPSRRWLPSDRACQDLSVGELPEPETKPAVAAAEGPAHAAEAAAARLDLVQSSLKPIEMIQRKPMGDRPMSVLQNAVEGSACGLRARKRTGMMLEV